MSGGSRIVTSYSLRLCTSVPTFDLVRDATGRDPFTLLKWTLMHDRYWLEPIWALYTLTLWDVFQNLIPYNLSASSSLLFCEGLSTLEIKQIGCDAWTFSTKTIISESLFIPILSSFNNLSFFQDFSSVCVNLKAMTKLLIMSFSWLYLPFFIPVDENY